MYIEELVEHSIVAIQMPALEKILMVSLSILLIKPARVVMTITRTHFPDHHLPKGKESIDLYSNCVCFLSVHDV